MVTNRRRLLLVVPIAMLIVGLLAGAAMAWIILNRTPTFQGVGEAVADRPQDSFSIDGDLAEPVSPGGSVPLNLSISNPLDDDILVSRLVVEVVAVDAPSATALLPCGVDDFAVHQLAGHHELVVDAGATVSLAELGVPRESWPQVLMLNTSTNQDGCKSASFSLSYSAVGRVVE